MSYTKFGFTPSLASLESNILEDECDEDENFDAIRKCLFDGSEESSLESKNETIKVYLRVRPQNQLEMESKQAQCFHFTSGRNDLLAIPPRGSQTFRNKTASIKNSNKYTFTKIFGPQVSQAELFEDTLLPSMKDFIEGQNCLVFTYGVTNSGKTYTVSGDHDHPGLLPRMLDVVFNSIQEERLVTDVSYKPKNFSEVEFVSDGDMANMKSLKAHILNRVTQTTEVGNQTFALSEESYVSDSSVSVCSTSNLSKASSNLSKLSTGEGSFELSTDNLSVVLDNDSYHYSIWISYAEIYNEFIYDLLGDPPVKGKPRSSLKLSEDRHHNLYIKGLREIQVSNVSEAMQLLEYGLKLRSVASTRLNYCSSRSHSVYTVKLVKVASPNKPSNALVSRVSIVDLAGAERSSKTGASGARMKEAGQINKSLLTLGKCIEAMKRNQLRKGTDDHIVPFRESKLTRLFQNYFVGKGGKEARQGRVMMFVNISNANGVFDETLHVLKFSALTSKVIPLVKQLPGPTPHRGPGQTPATVTRSRAQTESTSSEGEVEATDSRECQNCKEVEELLTALEQKNKTLQGELVNLEYKIRNDVTREYSEMLVEIEENHTREMEEQAGEIEETYEKRMKHFQKSMKRIYSRKRRRQDDDEGDGCEEEGLQQQLGQLQDKCAELDEELQQERNRAAAVLRDTAETHETRVVTLNDQLNTKSVELLNATKSLAEQKQLVRQLNEKLDSSNEFARAELEILTSRISELTAANEQLSSAKDETDQYSSLQTQVGSLEQELISLKEQLASSASNVKSLLQEKADWETRLTNEMSSVSVKLAVKNEQLYKLQTEKESLDEEVRELRASLEQNKLESRDSLSKMKTVLKDYEVTLKNQTDHINRLERENELVVSDNEELSQQCTSLDLRLSKATAAKESLNNRVEELSNSIEDAQRALTQREASWQDSSDQYRAVSEDRIAELRKNCATLEHELTTAREDNRALQASLSDKEAEVLTLTKSCSCEKATAEAAAVMLEDLNNKLQEQQASQDKLLGDLRGNSQLELSNYTIRIRELTESLHEQSVELEAKRDELDNVIRSHEAEIETVRAQWNDQVEGLKTNIKKAEKKIDKLSLVEVELKGLKKCSQQQKKELESERKQTANLKTNLEELQAALSDKSQELLKIQISHETAVQRIKEEWRAEVSQLTAAAVDHTYEELPHESPEESTLYESVADSTITSSLTTPTMATTALKPVENTANSRKSYLAAMSSGDPVCNSTLDLSKPRIAILESSSQLEETQSSESPDRKVIDATPKAARKKRKKKTTADQENLSVPPVKKTKYGLRDRTRKLKDQVTGDTDSLNDFTPKSQKRFAVFNRTTKKSSKKVEPSEAGKAGPSDPSTSGYGTRSRVRTLRRKSQLAPPQLYHSPANPGRKRTTQTAIKMQFGRSMRPATVSKYDDL